MTPAEAGRNAIKMMLYYAIRPYALKEGEGTLSEDEARVMQKAIALYNTYCFGYALARTSRTERPSKNVVARRLGRNRSQGFQQRRACRVV